MGYRSVVITSSVKLSVKNAQLVIEGEASGRIPIEDVRSVIVESRASTLTSYALSSLADAGVCVYFCDEKHIPSAVLLPFNRHSRQKKRILEQMAQSKPRLKRTWQSIVERKIKNQAKCLAICGVDDNCCQRLARLACTIQSGDVTNVEGQAALYFKYLFGKDFSRGEETPVNAALNYGYAIIRGYLARTLAGSGFEPSIGIHHHSEQNAFNLADDLIEPFRPLVDAFVFKSVPGTGLLPEKKRELCNLLNYEMLSGGERHSVAYSIERLVYSLERMLDEPNASGELMLPELFEIKRHEYE